MYKNILIIIGFSLFLSACQNNKTKKNQNNSDITVAAYYFPNYHPDKRNEKKFGNGWTEWELVKDAVPRFDGHHQPNLPLWGFTDESDPVQMAQKIDAATDHGIDAFIFDWYYYDDGLFLERGLEDGFMKAENNDRMKFSLMWANHNWVDIHPIRINENGDMESPLLYPGKITLETWDKMTDYIINKYFNHPSYWKIDGAPYFSIYDLTRFIDIFGSLEAAKEGIAKFEEKVKQAGFPGLHLNAVIWGRTILPSEEIVADADKLCADMGFASTTSYVWIHHVALDQYPETPYSYVENKYFEYAQKTADNAILPYFPNVTMGWDASPRCAKDAEFKDYGYPCMARISDNTPEAFKNALIKTRDFLNDHPKSHNILNINCWNEWTEGSYLEPDKVNGYKYLEAVKDVFGEEE